MDRREFYSNSLTASDPKLTRAYSFSDLPTSQKVTFEERYYSQTCGSLVKQYSCEQILDDQTRLSHYTVTHLVKSNSQEFKNIWKKDVPTYNMQTSGWPNKKKEELPCFREDLSFPVERLSITGTNSSGSKKILAPPKLIVNDGQSLPNSQNSLTRSSSSNLSRYESCDDSFHFKRPSTVTKRSNTFKEPCAIKDGKAESEVLMKKNCPASICGDYTKNEEDKKYKMKSLSERLIKLNATSEKCPRGRNKLCTRWVFFGIILLLAAAFYSTAFLNKADIFNRLCDPHFEINAVTRDLSKLVHGQNDAVNKLVQFFNGIDGKAGFNVLVLVGGIGVGKSYTSEIIKNNLKRSIDVFDFYPPLYSKEKQALSSLSICKCNLIRLENLKYEDIIDAANLARVLKERAKNYCVFILAIFNPEEVDHNLKRALNLDKSTSLIESKFEEASLKPTIVNYVSLDDEALRRCIVDLADYANVELTSEESENIKKNLIVADSGCKGAYAKIQITGNAVRKASSPQN